MGLARNGSWSLLESGWKLGSVFRKALMVGSIVVLATAVARAQPVDPIGDLIAGAVAPEVVVIRQPTGRALSAMDQRSLEAALSASKRGDVSGARAALITINDPIARKLAVWAMTDAVAESLSFFEVEKARGDLAGWPRGSRRQAIAEKLVETSGKSPSDIVAWFAGQPPQTAYGAMALATAYRSLGQPQPAAALIRTWWRDKSFEADAQRSMLARFPDILTVDDHVRRADVLLYGAQGPAAREMVALIPVDRQPAALARIALRADAKDALAQFDALVPADQATPGVAFERAAWLRRKGLESQAVALIPNFPRELVTDDQADRIWYERARLILSQIRVGEWRSAYQAAANSGLNVGSDATDAEFYAGWIALTRLNDAEAAGRHFAAIARIGSSPITRGRALYWQGRAAEARGEDAAAKAFYEAGAQHQTVFYGQLAAEKLGRPLTLVGDPVPTDAQKAAFEANEMVQSARLLMDLGQKDLFRVFVLHLDDVLPSTVDAAQLVDMIRGYGDQDSSMKAVRASAQRGLILTDRGYPYRTPPQVEGGAEPALVLGITRQESGFDPFARSGANARGMMQLLPATARTVARRVGLPYAESRLNDPDYNMTLGSSFIGQLVGQFSGSYIMATAGYNAGPGRPTQWSSFCGDPRGGSTDPLDFIECIPFGETRNYVMRVLENTQVYRAKLAGGAAPITLTQDLKRGGYSYSVATSAGTPGASP